MTPVWIGAALPPSPGESDYLSIAAAARGAGVGSVWMGDHTLMVSGQRSRYPYTSDGVFPGAPDLDWYDWLIALAHVAAVERDLRVGVAATVPVLREPVVLAKQIATLDRLSGGRITIAVATGWLEEEFDALGVPFRGRGARLDALLDVMREVWSGHPRGGDHGPYRLLPDTVTRPTPLQDPLPVLVAGDGEPAMRRAVRRGQGWLTVADPSRQPIELVLDRIRAFHVLAAEADAPACEVVVRVPVRARAAGTAQLGAYLDALLGAGVRGFVCDVSWRDLAQASDVLAAVREHVGRTTVAEGVASKEGAA